VLALLSVPRVLDHDNFAPQPASCVVADVGVHDSVTAPLLRQTIEQALGEPMPIFVRFGGFDLIGSLN
jgi:hypothetical protein